MRTALANANADTVIRIVLDLATPDDPNGLPLSPRWRVVLPLLLDPGQRRVINIATKTIIFGDPSYDRQLASRVAGAPLTLGEADFLLSADRKQYDLERALHFAGGLLDRATG